LTVPALPASAIEQVLAGGAALVDLRDRDAFAAGHVPGSLNVELGEAFGQYLGWLVPPSRPVAIIAPEPASTAGAAAVEAGSLLMRTGHRVVGRLLGGFEAWVGAGRPVRRYPVATMRDLYDQAIGQHRAVRILDVRPAAEWAADGGLPGSERVFVPDLPRRMADLADPADADPWWVLCTTGARAAVAASYLDGEGVPVRLVGRGGVIGWVERFEAAIAPT
jgi:rhodanese-related sulfurtransferase